MATFNAGAIEATLELDRSPFQRGIELARQQGRTFARSKFEATLDADTSRAQSKIAALEAQLAALGRREPTVDVDADTAAAQAQIALLQAQLAALEASRTEVSVDVDAGGMAASRLMSLVSIGAALGPALIPGITGATAALGGLVSMVGIAGAGLATLGAGLIGNITRVTGAQKELTAAQDASTAAAAASAAAQDNLRNALASVGDAERNLAAARRNASFSTAQAEGALADAQQAARRAQEDLNVARREAAERLRDMRDELRGSALDEEGSELAVRAARLRLAEAMEDPTSTMLERQQAQLDYDRAVYNMDQAREAHDELQVSVKRAQEAGVAGDAQVVAARDRVRDANERVQDAEANVSRTRADGARAVADAQRGLVRAQENAARAQRDAAAAATAAAEANRAVADSMTQLDGPAAIFVAALERAKDAWGEFLDLTEVSTLGLGTQFLDLFTKYMPDLAPIVNTVADAVSRLLDEFEGWADNGGIQGFVDFMERFSGPMIVRLGRSLGNLVLGLAGVVEAFAPFALEMMGPDGFFAGFKKWGQDLDKSDGFRGFLDYVRETGPAFLDFLGSAWDALLNIGKALAPGAMPILEMLTASLDFIAGIDPTTLGLIAGGIMAIVGGIMLYTGGAPIVGALLLIAGLSHVFTNLANGSDDFSDALDRLGEIWDEVWTRVSEKWTEVWEDTLKPGLLELKAVFEDELLPAFEGIWPIIRPILFFFTDTFLTGIGNAFDGVIDIVKGGLRIIGGALDFWIGLFTGDWERMGRGFEKFAQGSWDVIKGIFKLAFGGIYSIIDTAIDRMGISWARIGNIFMGPVNDVIRYVLNPLIDAINFVSNGLGGGDLFSKIDPIVFVERPTRGELQAQANSTGAKVDRQLGPIRAATGAVLPGFTPGQDTLHYKSPTGPDLHLSGGESIMVPEWTRAVGGAGAVKAMNAAARYGDKMRLHGQHERGRFFLGGTLPLDGGTATGVHSKAQYPWAAWSGDLNSPNDLGNPPSMIRAWKAGEVAQRIALPDSYGNHYIVNHGGQNTLYAHLSEFLANVGDKVGAGTPLGYVGDTGNATGAHLHFEVRGGSVPTGVDEGGGGGLRGLIGGLLDGLGKVRDYVSNASNLGGGRFGLGLAQDLFSTVGGIARGWINDKIPGPGPIPSGIFDQGGKIMPGYTNVLNLSGKPEALLNDEQWRLARQSLGVDRAGSRDAWSREDIERLIDAVREANPVVVPASDDTSELVSAIGFELRTQDRGGAR